MKLDMLAIDIGKRSFQIHGIDADGCIVSRKISRGKLAATVERLDPQIVFMDVRRQIIWDTGCHDGQEGLALVGRCCAALLWSSKRR